MFIAMNRFKVKHGQEKAFEDVWKNRDTHLKGVPGFKAFSLLKGPRRDDHTLYSSHTIWASSGAFEAWTKSEAFRAAHRNAGDNSGLYLSHPEFEGFEVVQEVLPETA
jgi:heme-degrading monooxygenase HmoA